MSELSNKIVNLVTKNPGKYTRQQVAALLTSYEEASVNRSLGMLLSKQDSKIFQGDDDKLYPAQWQVKASQTPDENRPTRQPVTVEEAKSSETDRGVFSLVPAWSEPIELPEKMASRSFDVAIRLTHVLEGAKRAGVTNKDTIDSSVQWIPPGGEVLEVLIGSFLEEPEIEILYGRYLVYVIKDEKTGSLVAKALRCASDSHIAVIWRRTK